MVEQAVAPGRSVEQRMEALARANEVRVRRAELKIRLKQRRIGARDVLLGNDPDVASMKLFELLLATPKVGRVKANRLLARVRVSPSKTIGGLTDRQRRELVALLPV